MLSTLHVIQLMTLASSCKSTNFSHTPSAPQLLYPNFATLISCGDSFDTRRQPVPTVFPLQASCPKRVGIKYRNWWAILQLSASLGDKNSPHFDQTSVTAGKLVELKRPRPHHTRRSRLSCCSPERWQQGHADYPKEGGNEATEWSSSWPAVDGERSTAVGGVQRRCVSHLFTEIRISWFQCGK